MKIGKQKTKQVITENEVEEKNNITNNKKTNVNERDDSLPSAKRSALLNEFQESDLIRKQRKYTFPIIMIISLIFLVFFLISVSCFIFAKPWETIFTERALYCSKDCRDYYVLIPLCLCGLIPGALLVTLLRGLYHQKEKQDKNDITELHPIKVAIQGIKPDISE